MSVRTLFVRPMAILQAGLCAGLSVGMLANVAIAGLDEPTCQCRSPGGERRDLGTVECVQISGSAWLVRSAPATGRGEPLVFAPGPAHTLSD